MITIKDKKDCCGCTACYNACPKKAIAMQADQEGFLYPVIDQKKLETLLKEFCCYIIT